MLFPPDGRLCSLEVSRDSQGLFAVDQFAVSLAHVQCALAMGRAWHIKRRVCLGWLQSPNGSRQRRVVSIPFP